jgi:hypothetical protein
MLKHPVIQLVREICTAIILCSSYDYVKLDTEDTSIKDEWVDTVRRNIDRIRLALLSQVFVPARDFGWATCELKWQFSEGQYELAGIKDLLNESTQVLTDETGAPVGIRNNVPGPDGTDAAYVDIPTPYKGFLYTYDNAGTGGYVYGRSWLENVRDTAWKEWLDCAQQLARLGVKITGMVTIVTSPSGTYAGPPGEDGKPTQVSFKSNAEQVIRALSTGAPGVWFPSMSLVADVKGTSNTLEHARILAELASKSLTNVQVLDYGNHGPAINGLIERMKHAEELMFNGGHRSARTGLEAQHGTKEEAGVHTDTGTMSATKEDMWFASAVQSIANALLELNHGQSAIGKILVKPSSLVDRKVQAAKAMLLAFSNEPNLARELAATVDVNQLINLLGLSTLKKFDIDSVMEAVKEASAAKQQAGPQKRPGTPEPQGGRPKENE